MADMRYRMVSVVLLLAACSTTLAHRLDADYVPSDEGFRIEFFLGDGSPGADLAVTAQLAGGEPMEIGRTDDQGMILFVPPAPGEWKIVGAGAGHSTSRNPLMLQVDRIPETKGDSSEAAAGSSSVQSSQHDPEWASNRGRFPWWEVVISLGFITFLTLVTLAMMRRSAHGVSRPAELEQLAHEVAHLRATVSQLREEVTELKEHREVRP